MRLPAVLVLVFNAALTVAQSQPAAPAPVDAPVPAHLAPETALALAEKKVPAAYPEKARASGIQGNVVLKVLIAETGEVRETSVISGDPELAQAAVDAIKQWKYKPYAVDGKPTPVETEVTFGFHIKAPPPPPPLGHIRDGRYQNEFFGISYPLSNLWIREPIARTDEGQHATILLEALHIPGPDMPVVDSSLLLAATPLSGNVSDARSYLETLVATATAGKEAKLEGEISQLEIAGFAFYRVNLRPTGERGQHQAVLCAGMKGYALQWIFRSQSKSILEEVVASLKGLSKLDTGPANSSPDQPASSTEESASPQRVTLSKEALQVFSLRKAEPRYPQEAKSGHIQGVVALHAVIDKEGNIVALRVLSGPRELVAASVEAVRQWKYRPYLLKGEPVEVDTTIEVRYTLGG